MAGARSTIPLSESLQDYLEAVYLLVLRDRVARMTRIADRLGVGKSSVTGAVRALAARRLVHYGPYQFVTLTEEGEAAGQELIRRHRVLKRFLNEVLAVPEEEAEAVGCKMEHAVKGDILDRFVGFLDLIERQSRADGAWAAAFGKFQRRCVRRHSAKKRKAKA